MLSARQLGAARVHRLGMTADARARYYNLGAQRLRREAERRSMRPPRAAPSPRPILLAHDCRFTRAGVDPYTSAELGLEPGTIWQVLRSPDALHAALRAFGELPILSRHVRTAASASVLVVGRTRPRASYDYAGLFVRGDVELWDRDAAAGRFGRELSAAYRFELDRGSASSRASPTTPQ